MLTLQEVDCLAVLEERDAINESAISVLEDIMVVFEGCRSERSTRASKQGRRAGGALFSFVVCVSP